MYETLFKIADLQAHDTFVLLPPTAYIKLTNVARNATHFDTYCNIGYFRHATLQHKSYLPPSMTDLSGWLIYQALSARDIKL